MKNIHVLPTDNPSRIYLIKSNNKLGITSNNPEFTENFGSGTQNQNIYITSDEEIKEGDWCIDDRNTLNKIINVSTNGYVMFENGNSVKNTNLKKIILTTDQDLIKDGVQAIDDEFLEWFVKNPSCEEVEIIKTAPIRPFGSLYKIIIQKNVQIKCYCGHTTTCDCGPEEPKQETLEEFAEREASEFYKKGTIDWNKFRQLIEVGAKWQMDKQDSFTISFVEWLNEIQSFHSGENAYYFQGKWYSYKEILEFYKNIFPR